MTTTTADAAEARRAALQYAAELAAAGRPEYVPESFLVAWYHAAAPRHRNATGYGAAIPAGVVVLCRDGIRRRVYIAQWGNAGTPWIHVAGRRLSIPGELCPDSWELVAAGAAGFPAIRFEEESRP